MGEDNVLSMSSLWELLRNNRTLLINHALPCLDMLLAILVFHNAIKQGIRVVVNPNCINVYAVLKWTNDMKLCIFAIKDKANSYSGYLIHFVGQVSISC